MKILALLFTVFSLMIAPAWAQVPPDSSGGNLDIRNLCASIASPLTELKPAHSSIRYQFESMIYAAADVKPSDTDEQVNSKVRSFLDARMPQLLCSQPDFVPNNGNILKLAVSRQSSYFIRNALDVWKLDLNQVDATDGRTVLDHIVAKRDSYSTSQQAWKTFQRYYDRFRVAGAKTRAELEVGGTVQSVAGEQARLIAEDTAKAQAGDFSAAMHLWGVHYGVYKVYGRTITPDPVAAQKWRRRAEEMALAHPVAKNFRILGDSYRGQDDAAAAQWLERAVALDDPDAEFLLGRAYAEGTGVPKDLNRALALMTQANNRDLGGLSLLWGGSISGWLGNRERQIAWYRTAWQQGVRTFAVPGYPVPPPSLSDLRGPLAIWFGDHNISECGTTIWGDDSCPH